MYSNKEKKEFILLRAKGFSFNKIAEKLNVSKGTLINWSKDLSEEISNHRLIEQESLLEEVRLTKNHRVKNLGDLLGKIKEEIENRDFSDIPLEKLVLIYSKLIENAKKEETPFKFKEKVDEFIPILEKSTEREWEA